MGRSNRCADGAKGIEGHVFTEVDLCKSASNNKEQSTQRVNTSAKENALFCNIKLLESLKYRWLYSAGPRGGSVK